MQRDREVLHRFREVFLFVRKVFQDLQQLLQIFQ